MLPLTAGGTGATSAAGALSAIGAAAASHTHAAGDITSGTIATARLGSGSATASTLLWGDQTWAALAAADIPSLDASKITTGTIGTARLGSGSANSGTYLRGDQTWAAAPVDTTGSIVAGELAYFDSSSTLAGDASLYYDPSGNVLTTASVSCTQIKANGTNYWQLGGYTAGAPAATGYVTVTIGGTSRKLLAG